MRWFILLVVPSLLLSLPEEGQVVQGAAEFSRQDQSLVVHVASDKAIINYPSFNIGEKESVQFVQPKSTSAVLNRVVGTDPSRIFGQLSGNGKVFLINSNGIVFGPHCQVNVGSLIASTLDIEDKDFIKGDYRFSLHPKAKGAEIVNQGSLHAEGSIALLAPHIRNEGIIGAQAGVVGCIAGQNVTLDFTGDGLIRFAVSGELESAIIEHLGKISAPQGGIFLRLEVADRALKSMVNIDGLIEGKCVVKENGVIRIVGKLEGAIDVSGPDITTPAGGFSFDGPVIVSGPDTLFRAEGDLTFMASLNGSRKVRLEAPGRTICFKGPVGDAKQRFTRLTVHSHIIDQNHSIHTAGETTFIGEMHLGGNINTTGHPLRFKGPVIRDHIDHVKVNTGRGEIHFGSTLDADSVQRALSLTAGKGTIRFDGPIGAKGALGDLTLNASNIALGEVGGERAGVEGFLHATAEKEIQLKGKVVHAREQRWEASKYTVLAEKEICVITDGQPLEFEQGAIDLRQGTDLTLDSRGGALKVFDISAEDFENVTLQSGHGKITVGAMSGPVGHLSITGRHIELTSEVSAQTVVMEAEEDISQSRPSAKIVTKGNIGLNAKRGNIGDLEHPVWVKSGGRLTVGAHRLAVLKGDSADGMVSHLASNPPRQLFFNGFEYFNLEYGLALEEEQGIISIAPDLYTNGGADKVTPSAVNRRRAPLYYSE